MIVNKKMSLNNDIAISSVYGTMKQYYFTWYTPASYSQWSRTGRKQGFPNSRKFSRTKTDPSRSKGEEPGHGKNSEETKSEK